MAQWRQINQAQRGQHKLYGEVGINTRAFLADIVEDPQWGLMSDEEVKVNPEIAMNLFQTMVNATKRFLSSHRASSDILQQYQYQQTLDNLENNFAGRDGNIMLYKALHKVLKQERRLLGITGSNEVNHHKSNSATFDSQTPQNSQTDYEPEDAVTYVKSNINKMLEKFEEEEKFIEKLNRWYMDVSRNQESQDYREKMKAIDANLERYVKTWKDMHLTVRRGVVGPSWQVLENWVIGVKNEYILHEYIHDVELNTIDEMMSHVTRLMRTVLKKLSALMQRNHCLQRQYNAPLQDTGYQVLKTIAEDMEDLFGRHLRRCFVVEEQPERIVNVSQDRTSHFSLTCRLLGGEGLDLATDTKTTLKIELRAFQESTFEKLKSQNQDTQPVSNWAVVKSQETFLLNGRHGTYDQNIFRFTFESISVRDVAKSRRRPYEGKGQKKTLAAEEKNLVEAAADFPFEGKSYRIKAYTLPMMFITQPSQNWTAKGALVWYTAFAIDRCGTLGVPTNEDTQAPAKKVAEMLANVFKKFTQGEELPNEQEDYLMKKVAKIRSHNGSDIANVMVQKDSFMRTSQGSGKEGIKFSFWKWFLGCINLVENRVKWEWNRRYIYGFCTKAKAEEMLRDKERGTYLIRFSESAIENSASSAYTANLTVVVMERDLSEGNGKDSLKAFHLKEHLEGKKLEEKPLGVVVKGMEIEDPDTRIRRPLLLYLYPTMITSEEAFGTRTPEEYEEGRGDYVTDTEQRILIHLWEGLKSPQPQTPIDLDSPQNSVVSSLTEESQQSPYSPPSVSSPGHMALSPINQTNMSPLHNNPVTSANDTNMFQLNSGMQFPIVDQSAGLPSHQVFTEPIAFPGTSAGIPGQEHTIKTITSGMPTEEFPDIGPLDDMYFEQLRL